MKYHSLSLLLSLACFSSLEGASVLTINSQTGSWSLQIDDPLATQTVLFNTVAAASWFQPALPTSINGSSTATIAYNGVYDGSPVSGSASLNLQFANQDLGLVSISFDANTPATSGTFSSLTFTAAMPLSNPSVYGPVVATGGITPVPPVATNSPLQLLVIPEPSSSLLAGLALPILLRRRRS